MKLLQNRLNAILAKYLYPKIFFYSKTPGQMIL